MTAIAAKLYTVEEYFAHEERARERHEFYHGELIPMPGETTLANEIASNILVFFKLLFRGKPFRVYDHDIKLMVNPQLVYRYPDLVVIHESGNRKKYVTDPILIVEVLSESTEQVDREKKRLEYLSLSSLQCYIMLHQDEPVAEVYSREGKRWAFDFYTELSDSIHMSALDCTLALSMIYEGVHFES
jgi:Uma2 family endonuclease